MPSFDILLTFFGVSVLLGLSPGPDNLLVLMQSALQGRRAGLFVVLGLCTGLLFHTAAVALGLAAVFAASSTAFTVLKLGGAAYLAYLAWQVFRAPVGGTATAGSQPLAAAQMYRRGVIMNLSNPKVVIFFLAFLPQFVNPAQGGVGLQIVCLGGVFILATLLTFGAIAWFAASVGQAFQRSARAQRALNWLAGSVFLGLAARLAISER
ncbi:Threonine/homoserine/homoserine lactone efflux protein [Polaromonas sp. OV174]|uniref:LysE family translocator n=1 Tax=Polaromonas sp. OV174 TaxID=1855300 RepID=UPI0008E57E94|nr:LysE family translocator [Polaromonas sp. OV174]SFB84017.1 Threonine/homoserine/homoserine lactone efflux protein [Polaromonas sp. OV174]